MSFAVAFALASRIPTACASCSCPALLVYCFFKILAHGHPASHVSSPEHECRQPLQSRFARHKCNLDQTLRTPPSATCTCAHSAEATRRFSTPHAMSKRPWLRPSSQLPRATPEKRSGVLEWFSLYRRQSPARMAPVLPARHNRIEWSHSTSWKVLRNCFHQWRTADLPSYLPGASDEGLACASCGLGAAK